MDLAITGCGVVSAAGFGVAALADALRAGRSLVGRTARFEAAGVDVGVAAEIPRFALGPALEAFAPRAPEGLCARALKAARRSPRGAQVAVLAALEAWLEAGLATGAVDPSRVGVVVAGHNVNQSYQHDVALRAHGAPEHVSPTYALHFMDFDLVGTLSDVLAIRGEGLTVGGASASGNVGIQQGARLVQCGALDACLVVGALADLSPVEVQAFRQLGAMGGERFKDAPPRACRPFDRDRDGFVYGEASAALVLETRESARRRGAAVIAELAGFGAALDGNRLSNPDPAGQARAIRLALSSAGLRPGDVDYVSTHGSASSVGDVSELAALREALGADAARVRLNATKAIVGHCLWSAGVVEAIATIVQMRDGFLHPSVNLEHPIDDAFAFAGPVAERADVRVALSNSFGFGGISTAIILRKGQPS